MSGDVTLGTSTSRRTVLHYQNSALSEGILAVYQLVCRNCQNLVEQQYLHLLPTPVFYNYVIL